MRFDLVPDSINRENNVIKDLLTLGYTHDDIWNLFMFRFHSINVATSDPAIILSSYHSPTPPILQPPKRFRNQVLNDYTSSSKLHGDNYATISVQTVMRVMDLWFKDIVGDDFDRVKLHEYEFNSNYNVALWYYRHYRYFQKPLTLKIAGQPITLPNRHCLVGLIAKLPLFDESLSPSAYLKEIKPALIEKLLKERGENKDLFTVPGLNIDGVKQITKTWDLIDEGVKMSHCIGGYVDQCLNREYLVFHIDDDTVCGATLAIRLQPGLEDDEAASWCVSDLRGECNDSPSMIAVEKSRQVLEWMNGTYPEDNPPLEVSQNLALLRIRGLYPG